MKRGKTHQIPTNTICNDLLLIKSGFISKFVFFLLSEFPRTCVESCIALQSRSVGRKSGISRGNVTWTRTWKVKRRRSCGRWAARRKSGFWADIWSGRSLTMRASGSMMSHGFSLRSPAIRSANSWPIASWKPTGIASNRSRITILIVFSHDLIVVFRFQSGIVVDVAQPHCSQLYRAV